MADFDHCSLPVTDPVLKTIINFRQHDPLLSTGGQPDAGELRAIGRAGFHVVINLGLQGAPYALIDERQIVTAHGMQYHHLPVNFKAPEIERFNAFRHLYRQLANRKCFIHCAANKRVSCFLALYRMIEMDWPQKDAEKEMRWVWEPDAAWRSFMEQVLKPYKT